MRIGILAVQGDFEAHARSVRGSRLAMEGLALTGAWVDKDKGLLSLIVLEMGDRRAGLVVDGMLGQREIVVKGFDPPQGTLPVFSGATIMGDGIPALILDAGGLV